MNFAEAIVQPSENKFLAVLSNEPKTSYGHLRGYKDNFLTHPQTERYWDKQFPIVFLEVPFTFCHQLKQPFVYMKNAPTIFSSVDKIQKLPIISDSKWLAVVETAYDNKGKVVVFSDEEQKRFVGIEEFDFINKNTFFRIPYPQRQNAICLEWPPKNSWDCPANVTRGDEAVLKDVGLLTNIFCQKGMDFLDSLEKVNAAIPQLETDIGRGIAQSIIELLEKKVIQLEFPDNVPIK